jgi:hypothetical protein
MTQACVRAKIITEEALACGDEHGALNLAQVGTLTGAVPTGVAPREPWHTTEAYFITSRDDGFGKERPWCKIFRQ